MYVLLHCLCFDLTYTTCVQHLLIFLQVTDWFSGDISVKNSGTGELVKLSSLKVRDGYGPKHPEFQRLVSLVEIFFHGFGGGSERLTTVAGLIANQLRLTNNLGLYFYAVHDKAATVKSPTKKVCKHKLPPSCFPLFVLFRWICIQLGCGNTSAIIPTIEGRTILMKDMVCELFGIDPKLISVTEIRKLYTSITNIIYHKVEDRLVADEDGSIVNNHTHAVQRRWYATHIINAEEARFEAYHKHLGEDRIPQDCDYRLRLAPITSTRILRALQGLFGQQAKFNSPEQEKMIMDSCNSHDRHKYIGLGCGGGKTCALLVPLAIEKVSLQFGGCRIFVLPYVFLVESLLQAFKSKLQSYENNLTILSHTAGSINDSPLPPDLTADNPPDILILTLDAASNLIQHHIVLLHTWHQANALRGVYFDEVQTFYGEFSFRPKYQYLRLYASIGCPISLFSGSFPPKMVPSLLKSFNLIANREDVSTVDITQSPDLVGGGIEFDAVLLKGDKIRATIEIVEDYIKKYCRAAHILCASKEDCKRFEERMKGRDDVRVVHSDVPKEQQAEAAQAWFESRVDQLYTTSLGTVGNENDALGGVFIVGILFNLSTFVQILGRLRPRHRDVSHSKVYQLLSDNDLRQHKQSTTDANNIRNDLLHANFLHENDVSTYNDVFHIDGYKAFVNSGGCYFQKLADKFSGLSQPCRNRCTWCRSGGQKRHSIFQVNNNGSQCIPVGGNPQTAIRTRPKAVNPYNKRKSSALPLSDERVAVVPRTNQGATNPYNRKSLPQRPVDVAAAVARTNQQSSDLLCALAERKLAFLKQTCPGCNSDRCDGEDCLGGACFICHDPAHQTRSCPFKSGSNEANSLDRFVQNKGICPYCLGKLKDSPEQHGPIGGRGGIAKFLHCPLKRRLKRAIGLKFHQNTSEQVSWGDFLRRIYSSDDKYYEFVDGLDIDVTAPTLR